MKSLHWLVAIAGLTLSGFASAATIAASNGEIFTIGSDGKIYARGENSAKYAEYRAQLPQGREAASLTAYVREERNIWNGKRSLQPILLVVDDRGEAYEIDTSKIGTAFARERAVLPNGIKRKN